MMKKKLASIVKSGIALILAACMVFNSAIPAMAAEPETADQSSGVTDVNNDGMIYYVSFGDSVTNGYGLDGYRFKDGGNIVGFKREVPTAYPALIRDELISQYGADKVDLEQLAISGFRMDELHWLLDEDGYVADDYHNKWFGSWFKNLVSKWKKYGGEEKGNDLEDYYDKYTDDMTPEEVLRSEYVNAIKKADLITIDLGTNNFGTFMTHQLQVLLGLKDQSEKIDMDFSMYMDENTSQTLLELLDQMVGGMVGGKGSPAFPMAQTIARTLLFGYLGFTSHFDASIEKIYEINPNAKVVVVDIYNMMSGVKMSGDTFGDNVDLSQLYGVFIDLANLYTRELSPNAQRVTHASFTSDPELLFDCYAAYPDENYPESNYMNPTSERLMNEFIMEAMGYDADKPEDREEFQKKVLDNIEVLDGYINKIQDTIKENVVKEIIKAIQPAVTGADQAIDGGKTAEAAVDTAVEGVSQAQELVNMIVDQVVPIVNLGQQLVVPIVKYKLANMDLTVYGFSNDDASREKLANEIFNVAELYSNEKDKASANRLAIIELIRFMLVETKGYSNEEAQKTAEQAYELNAVNSASGKDAAIKAALMTQVDETTANQALTLYNTYKTAGGAANHDAARASVIVGVILANSTYTQEQAEAAFRIYTAETDDNAATVPAESDFVIILKTQGFTEKEAKAVYACYVNADKNGAFEDPDVQMTMKKFMIIQKVADTPEKAEELYNQYLTYKKFPSTLQKLSNIKTIYIDYLLQAAVSGINLGQIAKDFMAGNLMLEEPVRDAYETDEQYTVAVDKYRSDSSLAILYMRFMAEDGVFIHPSDAGHGEMAGYVKAALGNMKQAEDEETLILDDDTRVLSIGDSIAAGTGLEDSEKNYGKQVAEALGLEYDELAVEGIRLNDVRSLLDGNYTGDAFTEYVRSEMQKATGIDSDSMSKIVQNYVKSDDLILVNLGAMNLGFTAAELQKYVTEGTTYPMTFSAIDAMSHRGLGANIDGLLKMVQGMLTGGASAVAPMLLAFESYGYGYTLFADSINETIDRIHELNPDATVVLVGQYDLLGNSYYHDEKSGAYMAIGDFFEHASNLMNTHCKYYADMHEKCVYVDISETETFLNKIAGEEGLNLADSANIATAFAKAHPTASGHEYIKDQIVKCEVIGHQLTESVEKEATCTETGTVKYACKRCDYTKDETIDAKGHTYLNGTCRVCKEKDPQAENIYRYVTFGASNTNGYGMRGYITDEELDKIFSGQATKNDINVYGYLRSPENSYTDLVKDYLAESRDGEPVELIQLAMSSMRVEELRVLLDNDYMGDDYTKWRFTGDNGWFKKAEPEGLDALRQNYQDSIAGADLITVDIGWNNFGVYVCNQLVEYLKKGSLKWDSKLSDIFTTPEELAAAEEIQRQIGAYVSQYISDKNTAEAVTRIFTYSYLGYITNFDICMEKINKLNPDADIVVLGIQNLLYGVNCTMGTEQVIPLGDIFGNFVNMANYYISARSPYKTNYRYVKAGGEDEHATLFLDDMRTYDGNAAGLSQNVKDCFDYYDDNLLIQTRIKMSLESQFGDTLGKVGYTVDRFLEEGARGELPDLGIVNLQEMYNRNYLGALNAAYDTVAQLVKAVAGDAPLDVSGLLSGEQGLGDVEKALMNAIVKEVSENATAAAKGEPYTVDIDSILPNELYKAVAAIYIRFYMGNSFFAHPSETGHVEIKDAIVGITTNPDSETPQAIKDELAATVLKTQQALCGARGHNMCYENVVKEASCTEAGHVIHSCACGASTENTYPPMKGHSFENGFCIICGEAAPPEKPDPEGECIVSESTKLVEGTLELKLGGTEVGTYTFAQSGKGWTIQTEDGKYVAIKDKALAYTDDAYVWTFESGRFSSEVKSGSKWGSWFDKIFGSSTKTYYLIQTDGSLSVSTSTTNSDAEFTVKKVSNMHSYDDGCVVEATCTEGGYTKYTCTVCGNVVKMNETEAKGHNYSITVVEPTCTEKGYTEHHCDRCGDTYKDTETIATGHNFVDGVCDKCGTIEQTVPEECVYMKEVSLAEGTYELRIGGTSVGTFTFAKKDNGWTIQTLEGTYVALKNGAITYADSAFVWSFASGRFSAEEKTSGSGLGSWFDKIFGSKTKTYYLTASGNNLSVSTDKANAAATFYEETTGEHNFGSPVASEGSHVYTCVNCGAQKTEVCTNPDCEICHPVTPEAKIDVSVEVTKKTSSSGWGSWFDKIFGTKTTYTAEITVKAEGTEVETVSYSTDGGSKWTEGTSFTSENEINEFDIRVKATNGNVYDFSYVNGKVIAK